MAKAQISTECCSVPTSDGPGPNFRLVGALAFFRHGARTPVRILNLPVTPEVRWSTSLVTEDPETHTPCEFVDLDGQPIANIFDIAKKGELFPDGAYAGELTTEGQRGHFRLGQLLRSRYVERFSLVPFYYEASKVHCRSTIFHRNLLSIRCLMAGLYPQKESLRVGDRIRVNVFPLDNDVTLISEEMKKTFRLSKDIAEKMVSDCVESCNEVLQHFGFGADQSGPSLIGDDLSLLFYRDEIQCRLHHNLPFPEIPEEDLLRFDAFCFEKFVHACVGAKERRRDIAYRAVGGPLFGLILNGIEELTCDGRTSPLSIFLTHDNPLAVVTTALGVSDGYWPLFGSSLIFELFQSEDDDEFVVQVHYDGKLAFEESLEAFRERMEGLVIGVEEVPAVLEQYFDSFSGDI